MTGVDGERATVRSEPLTLVDGELALGPAREETVRWSAEGSSLVSQPAEGDVVALHWDWVCDTLEPEQVGALRHWSGAQLRSTSRRGTADVSEGW